MLCRLFIIQDYGRKKQSMIAYNPINSININKTEHMLLVAGNKFTEYTQDYRNAQLSL